MPHASEPFERLPNVERLQSRRSVKKRRLPFTWEVLLALPILLGIAAIPWCAR